MNETEIRLLQLTSRALFHSSAEFDPAAVDWSALYHEASNQALTILIWDALTEEEHSCIPDSVSDLWEQNSLHHIMFNEHLLYEQRQVIRLLNDSNIPCVILKGSSSAACYPDPALRIMGDIDILVKPEQQMESVRILQANGYGNVLDEAHHCHMTIHKGGITVEVHKEPNGLFLNEKSEITHKIRKYFDDALERQQTVDGLPMLADDQQALVLILHKLEHFLTSGLGLRQLCDWAVFVEKKMTDTLWAKLKPLLLDFGLLTFTGVMTRACIDYLNMPGEKAPWALEYNEDTAAKVIEQILIEGNFGGMADKYGERLFNDANSSNRVTSFFRVLRSACRQHWPPCEKHPVLIPVALFVLLGRYLQQRRRGERPKLNLKKKYQQAGYDQKLYKALEPFVIK
ncbi:MAG: nucleotidyltransferase family protein [Lachnospiraceae bacterium]|nr:nucleotidyltransferase family protein [Lachnospiraceae bacterium]